MDQAIHARINRMNYNDLKEILEENGFAVNHDETEDDLREDLRSNVVDGTIELPGE